MLRNEFCDVTPLFELHNMFLFFGLDPNWWLVGNWEGLKKQTLVDSVPPPRDTVDLSFRSPPGYLGFLRLFGIPQATEWAGKEVTEVTHPSYQGEIGVATKWAQRGLCLEAREFFEQCLLILSCLKINSFSLHIEFLRNCDPSWKDLNVIQRWPQLLVVLCFSPSGEKIRVLSLVYRIVPSY